MQTVKGFVNIAAGINNSLSTTGIVGELSSQGYSYSRRKGYYQDVNIPGYNLITFKTTDSLGNYTTVQSSLVTEIIRVTNFAVNYSTTNIKPLSNVEFNNALLMAEINNIQYIESGPLVTDGELEVPSWISWVSTTHDTSVKIWLSDNAFINQYDEYEIVVIPPFTNVDTFFNSYGSTKLALEQISFTMFGDAINLARNNEPESAMRVLVYDYINALNPLERTSTNWGVLVYGIAGDNSDAIKEAVINYILTRSAREESSWTIILPDIFLRTEFVIIPRWDLRSVPNLTNLSSLYGNIVNLSEAISFATTNIKFYSNTHISNNAAIFSIDYKSLMLLVIPGINSLSARSLTDVFPDYIPVNTYTNDFSRMQLKTQEWVLLLEELIMYSETADKNSSIPINFRRIIRNNVLFISVEYDRINYLVAARSNTFFNT